jgi:hypothetical protein
MKIVGQVLLWLLGFAVLSTAIYAFGMWQYSWALPWQMKIERQAVKQSESFVNSQNDALSNMITQYGGLEIQYAQAKNVGDTGTETAVTGQERMILNQMCLQINGMAKGTVAPNISSFVGQHGGCQ